MNVDLYVCSSQKEEQLCDPSILLEGNAVIMHVRLFELDADTFKKGSTKASNFPFVISLEPRRYDFKTSVSFNCSLFTDTALFLERLTLQQR